MGIQNPGICTKCGKESRNRNWSHGVCEWCRSSEAHEHMEKGQTARIVVLGDNETWDGIPGAEVWEITKEALDALMEGELPKWLDESQVLSRKEIE